MKHESYNYAVMWSVQRTHKILVHSYKLDSRLAQSGSSTATGGCAVCACCGAQSISSFVTSWSQLQLELYNSVEGVFEAIV